MDQSSSSGVKPVFSTGKPLRIRSDILKVRHVPFTEKGDKIEPEQQPAARVITTDSEVNTRDGRTVGSLPTQIITEMTAGDAAESMRSKCFQCKNFDVKAWDRLRLFWGNSSNKEIFEKLNKVRFALLTMRNEEVARRSTGIDGDFDVEHALRQMGICQPLTELNRDPIIVSPISTCPDEVCTPENPRGLFVAKDKDHAMMGDSAYDKIMRMAVGKPAEHSVWLNVFARFKPLYFTFH